VLRFARNRLGRDFVVGDLHGMFPALVRLLDSVGFDGRRDRLFSVGDLIDRGPRSEQALEWLGLDWFHACRGNHEQFVVDSAEIPMETWIESNGGSWWLDLDERRRARFRAAFAALPFALEVETGGGRIGVVHADVPAELSWDEFTCRLEEGRREALLYALWSRRRLHQGLERPVGGSVSRVYCGHTPTRVPVALGNVRYIDTGAAYALEGFAEARLTMVEIEPGPEREHAVATAR